MLPETFVDEKVVGQPNAWVGLRQFGMLITLSTLVALHILYE